MTFSAGLCAVYVLAAVLAVMALLVGVIQLLGALGSAKQAAPNADLVDSGELIAILSAAAAEALGRPVAVRAVHIHRDAAHARWARAGRMDIMLSHRLEPRR